METSISRPIDQWISEYGESHQNPTNKIIHWICVPSIVFSVVGLFWSIPVPQFFTDASSWLNWGTILVLAALVYYFALSIPLAVGMLAVVFSLVFLIAKIDTLATPLWLISLGVFVIAWIIQFIGHHVEGKKPSFLKDVQFLMIGPLWLLAAIYRRLGIPY